jgi:hypothetical protein
MRVISNIVCILLGLLACSRAYIEPVPAPSSDPLSSPEGSASFTPNDCPAKIENDLFPVDLFSEDEDAPDWVRDESKPIPRPGMPEFALQEYCQSIGRPMT